MMKRFKPATALLIAAAMSGGAAQAAVEIVPHQALYRMSLGDIRVGTEINSVEGQMLFSWIDACEGWEIDQQYVLEFVYSQGSSLQLSSHYETWEAKDGSAFNFTYRSEANGETDDDIQGIASLPGAGEAGSARYRQPEEIQEALPADTLFPSAHTATLIRNAQDGNRFFTAWLFDGTDVQPAVELSAVIGRAREAGEGGDAGSDSVRQALSGARSWPVRLAFFPVDAALAEPEYEMSMRIFENGVVDELVIDYGDFEVRGVLDTLEFVSGGGC